MTTAYWLDRAYIQGVHHSSKTKSTKGSVQFSAGGRVQVEANVEVWTSKADEET